ncbi:Tn3 family transposase [Anaerobacillus isosaccharinicus]|uniref:DDE transposase n=1 Tax=Anaerobacillus isosaccharinicus TaxID=1532552 RepID=A0A1S2L108_9BACI|nr:Tn3 family transposase [Anaerobacillus isosaccharinicus]MBA5583951.1 Tn3 family transposase [Anaerobacillus isosaccharinicus]QOY37630.1 Tn3 family transposase [Anaerobacillus isosaccharinicus]
MPSRGREILSSEQREEYLKIPPQLNKDLLSAYFTLTEYDIEIVNKRRRDHNRLGFAIQLCVLRYPGWSLTDVEPIPKYIIDHLAKQLHVRSQEYDSYAKRISTKYEHLEEIRQLYGYTNFNPSVYRIFSKFLLKYALQSDNITFLITTLIDELRKNKVILPGITTIERMVWETRKRAEKKTYKVLIASISGLQKRSLLDLITVPNQRSKRTPLAWLREIPGQSSPDAFLKVVERLRYLHDLNLKVNTENVHPNRLLQLARVGSRYDSNSFKKFANNDKKIAILVAHLHSLKQSLIDQAIEIHDRQMMTLQSKGRKTQEEIQKQNGKSVNEKINHYANIGEALIKAKDEGLDPFNVIESIMKWEDVLESVEEAKRLARPMDYDYLDLLKTRYSYLRKYTPTLLEALEFKSTQASKPLLSALNSIKEMNKSNKRKIPKGAPLDFVPKRWKKHVYDEEGNINRQYYEMAALTELKNQIRSGDVWVVGSRLHKDFEEYLVSKDNWKIDRAKGTNLGVKMSYGEYISERIQSLNQKLKWVSENIDSLDGINIEKAKLRVNRLDKDTPEDARTYSLSLYQLLPRIKLTDLLIEVSSWTKFDEQFIHASTNKPPKGEEKGVLMAAIMAMGSNIGLSKMADSTPDISYYQIANTAQWRLHDEAMIRAQATLINYQNKLSLSDYWGKGTTSSSDGMRVQVGVSSLHADSNPHYGVGKGTTIYRFTSDQYSSFYTKIINTNARDAVHVIDGLLNHESDLNIDEHYTDTAGYTDLVFGLSHLLGFRFAPRLRDLSDVKLFTINQPSEFPNLEKILRGRINLKLIENNYDDVLRLAHSIREGTVSGSLIMGKLGSYARQNKLAAALREMGRIEKTIFILDYISSEALRHRIQKGLNKGEAMNGLARALFFGKRGELREKGIHQQLQRASALNILINAVSIWNTVYLTEAIKVQKMTGTFQEELIPHVSPLAWEHINLLGEYKFNLNTKKGLRELRT